MNKKLIKIIASITCGLGIAGSIPFVTTSCGSNSDDSSDAWPKSAIPNDYLVIDEHGTFCGFTSEFTTEISKNYDTLYIPNSVIDFNTESLPYTFCSDCPSITKLTFQKNSNLSAIVFDRTAMSNFIDINLSNCTKLQTIPSSFARSLKKLKKMSLPSSLITIDTYAFYDDICLEEVNFNSLNSLEEIGNYAFYNCEKMSSLTINSSISSIGTDAFSKCKNLNQHNVKCDSENNTYGRATNIGSDNFVLVKKIGGECLWSSSNLAIASLEFGNINFPEGITSIPEYTFRYSELDSVVLPSSIETLEENSFYYSRIKNLDLSNCDKLTKIDTYAFNRVTIDDGIDLSKCTNLTTISNRAFANTESSFIKLSKNIETLEEHPFLCASFDDIQIDPANPNFIISTNFISGKVLMNKKIAPNGIWTDESTCPSGLVAGDIVFPNNITKIADNAFVYTSYAKSVVFPDSLSEISQCGLYGFGPKNGTMDFSNCTSLQVNRYGLEMCPAKTVIFNGSVKIDDYALTTAYSVTEIKWVNLNSWNARAFNSNSFNYYQGSTPNHSRGAVFLISGSCDPQIVLDGMKDKGLGPDWTLG